MMASAETHAPHRAIIPPVPGGVARPLWSVMIPTYNCATYLREALASVLAQDPGPEVMQIEVVDDCSDDDPESIVAELAGGRVGYYRQPENVGHTRNFNTCLLRSCGQLVHLLHGDDCVREGFYREMQSAFAENAAIGAAFCRFISMDERGNWQTIWPLEQCESGLLDGWPEKIAAGQRLQTPCMTVRREVYEKLGGFDQRLTWTEDWEMWARIAVHYPVWYLVEPLALYRVHSRSNSGRYVRTGETIRDARRTIDLIQSYFPTPKAQALARQARENCALAAMRRARRLLDANDARGARAQALEGLRCSFSWLVARQTIVFLLYWVVKAARSH